MAGNATRARLEDACEALLRGARDPGHLSSRGIADRAGTTASAINHHFGSLEGLVCAVAHRIYGRLNAERLALLQEAVEAAAPHPAPAAALVRALIGPSVRWSLDPRSGYGVLRHVVALADVSGQPDLFEPLITEIAPHTRFAGEFARLAPWLTPTDVGFRLSAILGIRSQVLRERRRTYALTAGQINLDDAETLITRIVTVAVPMFAPPSNAVQKPSHR